MRDPQKLGPRPFTQLSANRLREAAFRSDREIRTQSLSILEHSLEHVGLVLISRLDIEHEDFRPSDQQISPVEGVNRDICNEHIMSAEERGQGIQSMNVPIPMLFFFLVTLNAHASEPRTVTSW